MASPRWLLVAEGMPSSGSQPSRRFVRHGQDRHWGKPGELLGDAAHQSVSKPSSTVGADDD
jgi:hypothetical protein